MSKVGGQYGGYLPGSETRDFSGCSTKLRKVESAKAVRDCLVIVKRVDREQVKSWPARKESSLGEYFD